MRRWPSKSVAPFIQAWFVPVLMQGDVDFSRKLPPAKFTNCGLLVVLPDPAVIPLVLDTQQSTITKFPAAVVRVSLFCGS